MSLISLIVAIVIVGLLLWLVGFIPMDPTVRKILQVVVIVFLVLWLISVFFGTSFGRIRIGELRLDATPTVAIMQGMISSR